MRDRNKHWTASLHPALSTGTPTRSLPSAKVSHSTAEGQERCAAQL